MDPSDASSLGVVCFLDRDAESRVAALAARVQASSIMAPHLSLGGGYSAGSSREDLLAKLTQFAADIRQLPIQVGSLGVFRNSHGFTMAQRVKLATEMMSTNASLHADQAPGQVRKPASTWPRDHF
jgi:hypothetical protein